MMMMLDDDDDDDDDDDIKHVDIMRARSKPGVITVEMADARLTPVSGSLTDSSKPALSGVTQRTCTDMHCIHYRAPNSRLHSSPLAASPN